MNREEIKRETIKVTMTTIGEKTITLYGGDGNPPEPELWHALACKYGKQRHLYKDVFGVSYWEAKAADWDPNSTCFDTNSQGWVKFMDAKGKLCTKTVVEDVSVKELLFSR